MGRLSVCTGCGAPLQSADKTKPGFVPAAVLERGDDVVCRRCFRITHYGEMTPIALDNDDFQRIISSIPREQAVVVHVVDVFDFHGSWMDNLADWIGNTPVVIAANKADLLPESANLDKVTDWLERQVERRGHKPLRVFLISAETGYGVGALKSWVEQAGQKRSIYMVGHANVGKSTLINRLVSLFEESRTVRVTASRYPGTTVAVNEINVAGLARPLVDTPGLLTKHRLTDLVCADCLRLITATDEIRPRVFQLHPGQTLWLGGLCRFDYSSGPRQSFVVYTSNALTVHRTKLENAESLYERHVGEMLTPPCEHCPPVLRRLKRKSIELGEGPPTDVVVSGIGWISIRGEAFQGAVWAAPGIAIDVRRAVI